MRRVFTMAIALVVTTAPISLHGQTKTDESLLTINHYLDLETVGGPQLSPDGDTVIYTRRHVDKIEDEWVSELWIMAADGSKNRFLAKGSSVQWSPDGTRIAFLKKGDPKGTQIFVRWMDAEGATSQITHVDDAPVGILWSPDSRSIAFRMLVPKKENWDIDMPAAPDDANWTAPPRMVTETHYRMDRQGFYKEGETHLFTVPADGGTPRRITSGAWSVGSGLDWMPDGSALVFSGLTEEEPEEDGYRQSYIYAVDLGTRNVEQIIADKGQWSAPKVSPNGRNVVFTGFPFTLQTYHASELYTATIDGDRMRKISGDLDRDVGQIHWSGDSRLVYFTAGDRGTRNVFSADLNGRVSQVTSGTHMLSVSSMIEGGIAVGTLTSPQKPADVVRIDFGNNGRIEQLTVVNEDILADKKLGDVEEIWYTSTDDTQVQGWIVKPPDFDPSQEYPLILHIHGGPHGMYNVGFSYAYQNYAANGYVVLYTNPRGSTGYGTDFGNAIDNGYPSVDHEDLMAGVDAMIDRGYVNEARMYVTGCSGGGVLSSWAIGQTDRFAAAAVRCPVTNWMSFAGTADIVQWAYHRFDGYFWENPDKWLEHSPLMHVGKVKTPVLLMTGELDLRTPMSQTEEYYAALKVLGVPSVMLRFNEEYHGTSSKPSNFLRTQLYIMDWFQKYTRDAVHVTGPER